MREYSTKIEPFAALSVTDVVTLKLSILLKLEKKNVIEMRRERVQQPSPLLVQSMQKSRILFIHMSEARLGV